MGATTQTEENKDKQAKPEQAVPELPQIVEESDVGYEDMEAAYKTSFRSITEGEVVEGRVLKVTSNGVIVDVGYKSEGMISLREF